MAPVLTEGPDREESLDPPGGSLPGNQDLVSIVIPCYNHGEYLSDSVGSALGQSWEPIEVIVVNDGSDEPETLEALEALERRGNPSLRVLCKENGHLSSARNHGIRNARGSTILTLDADDRVDPTIVRKGMQILAGDRRVGVVTTHVRRFDDDGPTGVAFRPAGGELVDFLVRNQACGGSLFRKECWEDAGGYDESMREGSEDWEFWISVTRKGWRVHSIPEPLYEYRDVPGSMYERTRAARHRTWLYILNKHEDAFQEHLTAVLDQKEEFILDLRERLEAAHRKLARPLPSQAWDALLRRLPWT